MTSHIATITHLSHEGRGIANIEGKTVFIAGAMPGERVSFEYVRKRGSFDEARVLEVLEASPDRLTPRCRYHESCGGCSLQYMPVAMQIEHKQQVLLEKLKNLAQVEPREILPPLTADPWHYRNKARLGARYVAKKEKVLVGFREINGRYIADMQSCEILHAGVAEQIEHLQILIAKLDAFKHIPQIEVACGDQDIALVFRHLIALSPKDQTLLIEFAKKTQMHIYLQPKGPDSIHKLWPADNNDLLSYEHPNHNIELLFHPSDFTQVNAPINQQLVTRVVELFDLQPHDTILDLFCGLGNFTMPLARYCEQITGVEGSENMVKRARHNAKHNKLTNTRFYAADLSQALDAPWAQQHYDKILLDPPRCGAKELIQELHRFNAKQIIYVSCDPTTLARDTADIVAQGYTLQQAGVMDMFTHTQHVESIAVFHHGKN